MKLSHLLIRSFLPIMLLLLIVTTSINYFHSRQILKEEVLSQLQAIASIKKNHIENLIQLNYDLMALVGSRLKLRQSLMHYNQTKDPQDIETMNQILRDAIESTEHFESITVIDLNGTVVACTICEKVGTLYDHQQLYKEGLKQTHVFKYEHQEQHLIGWFAQPLEIDNEIVGVLVVRARLHAITKTVTDYTGLGLSGEIVLADQLDNGDAQVLIPLRHDPEAAFKRIIKQKSEDPVIHALEGVNHLFEYGMDYRGIPVLAVTRFIPSIQWGIVVKRDRDEAFFAVSEIEWFNLILSGVTATLVGLICLWTARRISSPVVEMADTADNIAEGNYALRIQFRQGPLEMQHLSNSFNAMTDRLTNANEMLQSLNNELEQRVIERTKSLMEHTSRLQETQEMLWESQQMAHIGSYEWDILKNRFVISDEFYLIFQLKQKSRPPMLLGRLARMVHPQDRDQFEQARRNLQHNYIPPSLQFRICLPSGEIRHILSHGKTVFNPMDLPVKLLGTVQDVTALIESQEERNQLEKQLRQVQKMEAVGTLAGGIAHDFNNILQVIFMAVGLLETRIANDSSESKMLQTIMESGNRGKELVAQILTFSRKSDEAHEAVTLIPIIKETLKMMRSTLPSSITIHHHLVNTPHKVMANPTQLHQVLVNLCVNAGYAMSGKNGQLNVELQETLVNESMAKVHKIKPGAYLLLTVQDNGQGMEPEVLERIFEPFFTTKPVGHGTGLGLSVVHGIVRDHQGIILVESTKGIGSLFSVYLPVTQAAASSLKTTVRTNLQGQGESILLVDDETITIQLVQEMLENLNYRVVSTHNPLKALELFKTATKPFDLLLTDQTMPAMTGIELAERLLELQPKLKVVLMTGYSELATPERLNNTGIHRFILKPYTKQELGGLLKELLA